MFKKKASVFPTYTSPGSWSALASGGLVCPQGTEACPSGSSEQLVIPVGPARRGGVLVAQTGCHNPGKWVPGMEKDNEKYGQILRWLDQPFLYCAIETVDR